MIFSGLTLPLAPLLARADLVIMPSLDKPLGLAYLEALALGIPVAVSNAGGLPETVEHGRTEWILPSNDADTRVDGLVEAAGTLWLTSESCRGQYFAKCHPVSDFLSSRTTTTGRPISGFLLFFTPVSAFSVAWTL
ncbi:MAG: hypothetical protein Fur0032_08000 [Terrimicrobiaceae bacterium]